MSQPEVQRFPEDQHIDVEPEEGRGELQEGRDERTEEQQKTDRQLAEQLSILIEDANSRVTPICRMIRKVRWFRSRCYFPG